MRTGNEPFLSPDMQGRATLTNKMRRAIPIAIGVVLASLVVSTGVHAQAETAVMTFSAENNAALTVTFLDATNLNPERTNSDSSDLVFDYRGAARTQGTYNVWIPDRTGSTIEVSSNKVWSGTITTDEDSGVKESGVTNTSDVLKYVEGNIPSSWEECAAGSVPSSDPASWKSDAAPGRNVFVHFYCLPADLKETQGSSITSVSYTVTQS